MWRSNLEKSMEPCQVNKSIKKQTATYLYPHFHTFLQWYPAMMEVLISFGHVLSFPLHKRRLLGLKCWYKPKQTPYLHDLVNLKQRGFC